MKERIKKIEISRREKIITRVYSRGRYIIRLHDNRIVEKTKYSKRWNLSSAKEHYKQFGSIKENLKTFSWNTYRKEGLIGKTWEYQVSGSRREILYAARGKRFQYVIECDVLFRKGRVKHLAARSDMKMYGAVSIAFMREQAEERLLRILSFALYADSNVLSSRDDADKSLVRNWHEGVVYYRKEVYR